jgi:hypothetical protein
MIDPFAKMEQEQDSCEPRQEIQKVGTSAPPSCKLTDGITRALLKVNEQEEELGVMREALGDILGYSKHFLPDDGYEILEHISKKVAEIDKKLDKHLDEVWEAIGELEKKIGDAEQKKDAVGAVPSPERLSKSRRRRLRFKRIGTILAGQP